jgi:ATP-dependent DNA helicase DinG
MSGGARALLGPDGPLAQRFAGYEERQGQLEMADAVERALAEERPLLCEAGTGTGKTLAYLVPAILSRKRVVVSTATRALQEQVFHKDLPGIASGLGLRPEAALVKGLGNYLCLRRFDELRRSSAAVTDLALGRSLPLLEDWAEHTESGDAAELTALAEDDPLWREVASSSETRVGAECDFFDRCFVTRMKREAERARILVVNHHLFFADLAVKEAAGPRAAAAGVLPRYDAVIFDEAHQLEDVATAHFGTRVSRARLETTLRDAERAFTGSGLSDRLLSRGEGTALVALVREAVVELFSWLAELCPRSEEGGSPRTPLPREAWSGALVDAYHRLDTALETLGLYADANRISDAVALVGERAQRLRHDVASIVEHATQQVTWIESRPPRGSRRGAAPGRPEVTAFGASPVELGHLLRERIFDRVGAVVLTSATLTTAADGFGFFRSRMGLSSPATGAVELSVSSPFDHQKNALLYAPTDLPDAADPAFVPRAAERIAELCAVTGGGAFVLCTSVRGMRALFFALRGKLPRPPLLQGEAPKSALLARFKHDGHAVLVATMSFWEGVDVPGDALRLVIIEKIPFAVPTDPLVAARCARLADEGVDPFLGYSVPQAALTLKQGFGRLLRTRADRGVVAVLDRRVRTRGYGRALLDSLPPARRATRVDEVRAFWAEPR